MILLDGGLDGALQPCAVLLHVGTVKLVVDLEGHVGEEWRLRTAEIVRARAVKDLAVVLDLEDEVVDHALGHVDVAIDEEAEGDEVRVPVVKLIGSQ